MWQSCLGQTKFRSNPIKYVKAGITTTQDYLNQGLLLKHQEPSKWRLRLPRWSKHMYNTLFNVLYYNSILDYAIAGDLFSLYVPQGQDSANIPEYEESALVFSGLGQSFCSNKHSQRNSQSYNEHDQALEEQSHDSAFIFSWQERRGTVAGQTLKHLLLHWSLRKECPTSSLT